MIQLLEKRARKRLQNIKNMTIDDQPKEQLAADEERREELEKELGPLFQIGASPDGPWSTDEDGTRRTTLVKEQEAEVARMYEGVLNINPNDFAMIMKYARFEKEERHMMRHAIDLFEDALRLIPNDVEALRYGNLCLNDFKDFKAAYGLYHSALQADPKNHRAHYGMAYLHQQLGNRTKAAHHYELSLTLNPSFFPTLGNYASMLYLDHVDKRMGKKITDDIKRAAKLYETATLLQPSNTANLLNYGMLLENVFGEEVKAEFLYRTALTLEETNCDAICMLSKLIFKGKEDVGEVQSLLYQALETNPSHVQTLLRLGELYHNHLTNMSNHKIQAKEANPRISASAQLTNSQQFYESALQLDPNNVDVLNSLATLYAEMDSSDLNYTCSAEERELSCILNIGSYMMDSKQDMPTAKRLFRQALKLQPDHPGALCYNALAEALTGRNFTLAYFLMDRARALAPNEIHIQEALLSLDTLAMKERWDPTSSSKNNPPSLYVASIPVSGKSKSDPSSSGNQTSSSQGKGKAENKSEEKLEFEGPRRGYYYEELGNLRQIPSDIPDGSDLTDPRHEWNQF
ncbi:hypothetical protein GUITHDRAFT_108094 [Guillardia theta CCMP2712]|uniref:Uncharacterized protein n=1 Tax=Guillardia theta (strain CCMP2712) TaxID=905079 RepID=L1JBY2_GUITC|nr:hypothetical protein GUITHDRAFT_108094 [Guillardia theta CCMP2712]EKX46058.1 hypothetical protein GUITHDRAFT_108094 [Guillardia theta CCMP2712]|eukprot:XP_005833038.1 hypothetical protein GUITHDRAFT_108094 [Guillardia theta CCMP2712]